MKIKLLIFSILLLFFFVIQLKSGLGLSTPIYSLNSTNSTLAGTAISHNLKWNDDVGLSGYIFQFCNGTWNGTHCGPLPGWSYRRPITINNTLNSNTLTDYQVLVTLDTASLTGYIIYELPISISSTGTTLTDYQVKITITNTTILSHMTNDGRDIRFFNQTTSNPYNTTVGKLDFWIESISPSMLIVWVKVDSIPATGGKTIYLYYGNPDATSTSNGDATFIFFDNFSESSLNLSKWDEPRIIESHPSYPLTSFTWGFDTSTGRLPPSIYFTTTASGVGRAGIDSKAISVSTSQTYAIDYWVRGQTTGAECSGEQWILKDDKSGYVRYVYTCSIAQGTYTFTPPTSIIYLRLDTWDTQAGAAFTSWHDYVILRKYSSPEPTTSIGAETIKQISPVGKMRSDCGDIRFTDSDGATLLNYWLESGCNSANTKIWVKVPNIPASSTKTIYLYYGNPDATSTSNGDLVFEFFDDFSGASLNLSKWDVIESSWNSAQGTCSKSYQLENGELKISSTSTDTVQDSICPGRCGYSFRTKNLISISNFAIYAKGRYNNGNDWVRGQGLVVSLQLTDNNTDEWLIGLRYYGDYQAGIMYIINGSVSYEDVSEYGSDNLIFNYTKFGGNVFLGMNGTYYFRTVASTASFELPFKIALVSDAGACWWYSDATISWNSYYDIIIVRKYTFPEPTTSVGAEKIVGWVNDTWIAFTPAMCTDPYKECWSNVTKIVDLTVGAKIAWCVYVNDTSNNWNATSCENPFSYITTGVNVITINLNATKVWWNDSLIASGVAKYANGASVNGSVLLSVDNTNYSCSQTDANGNWNCTFNAPIRIGVHTLTVKITDNSGYTFQNSTFLTVSPYYGRKPIGSIPRIVYELPMLIQDLDGEIKRVLARIIVWKD